MNGSHLRAWAGARAKVCVALALLAVTTASLAAQTPFSKGGVGSRGNTGGKYALETDGAFRAWASGVEGGYPTADVVTEVAGSDHIASKHLAGVKYEDISMNVHPAQGAGFLNDALAKDKRMNGKVLTLNNENKAIEETDFFNALLAGFELSPLDVTSKEPCYVTLTLAPEITKHVATPGGTGIGGESPKKCFSSNFEVTISGLEGASKQVKRIEGVTITQKVVENAVGERRGYQNQPGHWDFSNVTLTLPEPLDKKFADWFDDFVVKGNNGHEKQKTMTVKLLAPDMKTTFLTLEASGVGIFKLSPETVKTGSEEVREIKAELYVTQWNVAK